MQLEKERNEVLHYGKLLAEMGLVPAWWGNVSIRDPETNLIAITPSNMEYERLTAEEIVLVDLKGNVVEGDLKPSAETPLHCTIYQEKPQYCGIVHTHSVYATAMSVLRKSVPVVLCNLASTAGGEIPVVDYVRGATWELAEAVLEGLNKDMAGVLLQNHGVVTVGPTLKRAFEAAAVIEDAARAYMIASTIGTPTTLPREEVAEIRKLVFEPKYGMNSK